MTTDFSVINDLYDNFQKDFKDDDIEVFVFPQMWGSTALGYSGIGGSAMTTAHTIVIHGTMTNVVRIYFGGGRLAYQIENPNSIFFEDLQKARIQPQSKCGKYRRQD